MTEALEDRHPVFSFHLRCEEVADAEPLCPQQPILANNSSLWDEVDEPLRILGELSRQLKMQPAYKRTNHKVRNGHQLPGLEV